MLLRGRGRSLVYRSRRRTPALFAVLFVAAVTGAALAAGPAAGSLAAGVVLVAFLAAVLRLVRLEPAGPGGPGPTPPGGAAVREPRRPLPLSPSGAAAIPLDDEDPPGRAVALA